MITADQLIEIGRYNKAHGINGEISATFDCDTMAVGELSALVSPMDGIFVPFFVNGIRPKNNEKYIAAKSSIHRLAGFVPGDCRL